MRGSLIQRLMLRPEPKSFFSAPIETVTDPIEKHMTRNLGIDVLFLLASV